MNNRTKVILALVLCLIVGGLIGWQRYQISRLTEQAEQDRVKAEAKAYESELEMRQKLREVEDARYRYEDSLRQALIDQLVSDNSVSKREAMRRIKAIKGAPDSYKDSIWRSQWATEDGPLFENQ